MPSVLGKSFPIQHRRRTPAVAAAGVQYTDSADGLINLTPSFVEVFAGVDAPTGLLTLVPSVTDVLIAVDSSTNLLTLIPSGVEGRQYDDSTTNLLTLIPSVTDVLIAVDASTGLVNLTPSFVEVYTGGGDTGTGILNLTPITDAGATLVFDSFNRTVAAGALGTPDTSPYGAWIIQTGLTGSFSVNGSAANINIAASTASNHHARLDGDRTEERQRYKFRFDAFPTTSTLQFQIRHRSAADSTGTTGYRTQFRIAGDGSSAFQNDSLLSSVTTTNDGGPNTALWAAGTAQINTWYWFESQITGFGSNIQIKVRAWADGDSVPDWQLTFTPTVNQLDTTSSVGIDTKTTLGTNTNVINVQIDEYDMYSIASEYALYVDTPVGLLTLVPSFVEVYTPSGTQYVDSGTGLLNLTPSATETAQFADTATAVLNLFGSATETIQAVDSSTGLVNLTPSGVDTLAAVDTGTGLLNLTPSSTDVLIAVDSSTGLVTLTPSAVELRQHDDSATNLLTLTPSVTDVFAGVDAPTNLLTLTPSAVEALVAVDTGTGLVTLTPSSTLVFAGVDAPTGLITLTPSFVEVFVGIDSGTGLVNLTPSAVDVLVAVDTSTGLLTLTPSAVELRQHDDSATNLLTLTPSVTELAVYVDSPVNLLTLTPSAVDIFAGVDTSTALLSLTPSAVEAAIYVDSATGLLTMTPSAALIFAGVDAPVNLLTLTPSGVDTAQYIDASTGLVNLSPTFTEVLTNIDSATSLVNLTPSATEVRVSIDSGTGIITLVPSAPSEGISSFRNLYLLGPTSELGSYSSITKSAVRTNFNTDKDTTGEKAAMPLTTVSFATPAQTGVYYQPMGKFYTPPLTVASITAGIWRAQLAFSNDAAFAHAQPVVTVYVLANDDTIRGYIYDSNTTLASDIPSSDGSTYYGSTFQFTGLGVAGVQSTDRIVIEVWLRLTKDTASPSNVGMMFGGTNDPGQGQSTSSAASFIIPAQSLTFNFGDDGTAELNLIPSYSEILIAVDDITTVLNLTPSSEEQIIYTDAGLGTLQLVPTFENEAFASGLIYQDTGTGVIQLTPEFVELWGQIESLDAVLNLIPSMDEGYQTVTEGIGVLSLIPSGIEAYAVTEEFTGLLTLVPIVELEGISGLDYAIVITANKRWRLVAVKPYVVSGTKFGYTITGIKRWLVQHASRLRI